MNQHNLPAGVECIDERDMPAELDAAIRTLLCECFPPDAEVFSQTRHWNDSVPAFSVLYRQAGKVLGHVGVTRRTIRVADHEVEVAGIQSVAVTPAMRGTGLAQLLMKEATSQALRRGIVFGLLFCTPNLEHFYGSLGYVCTAAAVTKIDRQGRRLPIPAKNITMFAEFADAKFPEGDIDLAGEDW